MQNKIVLVGYMGTGKSAIGNELSKLLNIDFIDLDGYIATQEASEISTIFEEKGELYFRKKEKEALEQLLNSNRNFILATGGGTPCYYNSMKLISKKSISFFINTPLNILVERLTKDKSKRPLIKHLNNDDLMEFIAKHLFERNQFYQQANYAITNNTTVNDAVKEIIKLLNSTTIH